MTARGTGNPKVQYNTRERVLSSDANRVQAMSGRHLAEAFRFLFDAVAEEDSAAGAVEALSLGSEAPMRGTVLSGLRCRPIDGTVDMLITPGAVELADNAGPGDDDSIASVVSDPGIQTAGVLTLTPGGGSLRIDVLECQRVTVVTEVENRDIFNPATGIFAPAQVDKVTVGRLVYRLRTGTPGAGFPGVVAGWLPLAVCCVGASASTWNTVVIWDVRPLASDRWNAPFLTSRTVLPRGRAHVFTDIITNAAQRRVAGLVEAHYGSYRAGGHLGVTNTTDDTGYFDVALAANRASNFGSYTANRHWYLYALFPFGLPRWVRYTESGVAERVPRGARGILAVTTVRPGFRGAPVASVGAPSFLGLGYTGTEGVCLLAGRVDAASPPVPQGVTCDGSVTWQINPVDVPISPTTVVAGNTAKWTLADDVAHPAGARAIWVRITADFAVSTTKQWQVFGDVQVTGPDGLTASYTTTEGMPTLAMSSGGALVREYSAMMRIPLGCDPFNPTNGGGSTRSFGVLWSFSSDPSGLSGITDQAHELRVLGWEMGP